MHSERRLLLRGTAASIAALACGVARAAPQAGGAIALEVPAVADNGAFVPVSVAATLRDAREIVIVVEGNPQPLAVQVVLPEGTEPFVATRIKMAGSGIVRASVRTADGRWHTAERSVEVMRGGCG